MWRLLAIGLLGLALAGCPETVSCPDDEIFDEGGDCIPIPDAGPPDAEG